MESDAELLHRYVTHGAEPAFTELVRRHLGLVYAAARQVGGDAHLAQDIAQQVFTALARKARSLTCRETLAGWLYLSTHHSAAEALRSRQRRGAREQEAYDMQTRLASETSGAEWDRVRPLLDNVMRELGDADREAVLLRYFEQRPFAEIGATLRLSEDAARMRVERALDKLHALLSRRGITSTSTALGLVLEGHLVAAVPPSLVAAVAGSALGATSAVGGTLFGAGFLAMTTSSITNSIAGAATLVTIGAAFFTAHSARTADAELHAAVAEQSAARATLTEVTERAAAEARQLEQLQKDAERPRTAAALTSAPARATRIVSPMADEAGMVERARDFLAAHPEAQRVLDENKRRSFDSMYGPRLRAIGLPAAEVDRVAAACIDHISGAMGMSNVLFKHGPENGMPLDIEGGRLQQLLSPADFQRYRQQQRDERSQAPVKSLVTASYDSDVPLQPAQIASLTGLIGRHSKILHPDSLFAETDWQAILAEAPTLLAPAQMDVFRAALQRSGMLRATNNQMPRR